MRVQMKMNCYYCVFYVAGLFLAFAYDDISYNKIATQSLTFASPTCDANKAVDGDTATCMRTKDIGSNAPYKTVWWKVDLGGVYNIYRINIIFKSYNGYDDRQKGRFAGFSLYVSNTDVSNIGDIKDATLCYKDGPQLPPLNFTTVCTEKGRYVIYYNERLEEVYPDGYEVANVYTEICEVIVEGCSNASFYGVDCNIHCPTNCKDFTCHIQSGTCFTCKPGWTGMYCKTKCGEGWYGMNCSQQCVGRCRNGTTCNHVTGLCERGCNAGWIGYLCEQECDDGTYGYNCVNNCSGHCMNNSLCNKQTGHCDRGCNPGYTNSDCNTECSSEEFGMDCRDRCSGHCINNEPCHHVSGVCPRGCQDGYVGTHCNNTCEEGYFGPYCSMECSPNCRPDTCRNTNGVCSCVAGWTGNNCTKACFKSYGEYCRYPCSLQCYNDTCDRLNGRCLLGCKNGFYGELCDKENVLRDQNVPGFIMLVFGLSVSVLINLIFIVCGIVLCRRITTNKVNFTGTLLSRWKKSVYQDTVMKSEEASTYQELDLYQNTTIR